MRKIQAGLIALAIVLFTIGSAQANLVVNGDFSTDANLFVGWPGYANYTATSTGTGTNPATVPGWIMNTSFGPGVNGKDTLSGYTAFPGPITIFGPSSQTATPDRNWAFIQSGSNAIYQFINVTPGVVHTVSFEAAGRAGNPANGQVYVYDGTLSGTVYGFVNPKSYGASVFVPDSFTFTPTSPTVTLVLQNGGGGDSINFTNVVMVPEPSTLAGLAIGVVALGLARRRMEDRLQPVTLPPSGACSKNE